MLQRNRLIRIIVAGEHCGFTEDMLKFESVVSLIDYYRRNSLLEYNRQLSTELLYPLRKPNFEQTSWVIFHFFEAYESNRCIRLLRIQYPSV